MEPMRSTDFLAAIRTDQRAGRAEVNRHPGTELLLKLPKLMAEKQNGFPSLQRHAAADFSLWVLVFTTATVVVTVFLNWSR